MFCLLITQFQGRTQEFFSWGGGGARLSKIFEGKRKRGREAPERGRVWEGPYTRITGNVKSNDMLVGLHVPTNFQMYRQKSEKALLGGEPSNCSPLPPPPPPPPPHLSGYANALGSYNRYTAIGLEFFSPTCGVRRRRCIFCIGCRPRGEFAIPKPISPPDAGRDAAPALIFFFFAIHPGGPFPLFWHRPTKCPTGQSTPALEVDSMILWEWGLWGRGSNQIKTKSKSNH